MADDFIGLDEPGTIDKKVDTDSLTVGANIVHRGRYRLAGAGATDIVAADAANGLDVDVTRVQGTVSVSAASLPLPAGAATAANQLPNSHDVTVDNAGAGAAVNIQDGGNSITVDGTVAISGTVDTELPASAALADTTANPTVPSLGTMPHVFNGTTWDRARGDTANGLDVDVTRMAALVAGTANIGDVDVLTVPAPLSTTGGGTEATALRVTLANDSTGLVSVDDNGGALTVDQATASSLNAQVVGNIAHDTGDAGNPVKVGGIARTANPTAVAALDRADLYMDDLGRPVVRLYVPRDLISEGNITLTTTTETTLIAMIASTFLDLTSVVAINTSATAVRIDFRDATAGTIRFALYVPAGDTRGFVLSVPKPMTAAGNNWTAQLSAAVTDVRIYAQAVRDV